MTAITVRQAIIRLRRFYKKSHGYSPRQINGGSCDEFAQNLLAIFPKGDMMWGEEVMDKFTTDVCPQGHCFFSLNGLYYDSETLTGVKSPDYLPFYQRAKARNYCI